MPMMSRAVWAMIPFFFLMGVSVGNAQDLADREQAAIQAAIAKVSPFAVQVETIGGLESVEGYLTNQGPTTGIILDENGHVLTSAINFIQAPSAVLIHFPDGSRQPAKVLAQDHARKLVLLKFDPVQPQPAPVIAPRNEIAVGQSAIAIGKAVDAATPNVSFGIVSAVNRVWGRAIQTDAKISPLNYGGPLIDIRGRIMGILVPLSPDGNSAVAGTDWYDSGIGFAVPLSDITPAQVQRMKEGKDLKPGLMGITLKGQNTYADPPIIALCPPGSPAGKAGMKAGDQIVAIDGISVKTHADVRHLVGIKMAGDVIHLAAVRDGKAWEGSFELVEAIAPYDIPYLGVLPVRAAATMDGAAPLDKAQPEGVGIHFVIPSSPADKAGLKANDRILEVNAVKVNNTAELREQISLSAPGDKLTLSCLSAGKIAPVVAELERQNEALHPAVPIRESWLAFQSGLAERPTTLQRTDMVIPEEEGKCSLWSPIAEGDFGKVPLALAVWLSPPGNFDDDAFKASWEAICLERGIAVLVPRPRHSERWDSQDAEFIRKTLELAIRRLPADPDRIAILGDGVGGSMAYFYGFANRQRVRGIAALDATIPLRIELRGNDPENRLVFFLGQRKSSANQTAIQSDVARLRGMRFPVVEKVLESNASSLVPDDIRSLVHWMDTLDRI
jgi:serine protease Do